MVEIYRFRDRTLGDLIPLLLAFFLFFIASYLTPPPAGDYTGPPLPGVFAWIFFAVTVSYTVLGNYAVARRRGQAERAEAHLTLPMAAAIAVFLGGGVVLSVILPITVPYIMIGMLAGVCGFRLCASWHPGHATVHIDWWGGMILTWILNAVFLGVFWGVGAVYFHWDIHVIVSPDALLFAAPNFMFLTIVIADWLASREAKAHDGPVVLGYFGGRDALFAVYALMVLAFVGGLYLVLGGTVY